MEHHYVAQYYHHLVYELFELLTGAYDILRDEKQRNQYNSRMNVIRESSNDFTRLKQQTTDYYSTRMGGNLGADSYAPTVSTMPEKKAASTVNLDKVSDTPLNKGESKRMLLILLKVLWKYHKII